MTVLGDFIVLNSEAVNAATGKWRSDPFETGGRLILEENNVEQHNAYVVLTLTSPAGGHDVAIRVIINSHPLQPLVVVKKDSRLTTMASFPASYLNPATGKHNAIELHSQGELGFIVLHAVCHFRQNS